MFKHVLHLTINGLAVALMVELIARGYAGPVFSDITYITHGIAILGAFALLYTYYWWFQGYKRIPLASANELVSFCSNMLVTLGLLGTVVGFIMVLVNINPDSASSIEGTRHMITNLIQGMGTAMFTTLVGCIGDIWVRTNLFLMKRYGHDHI